MEHFHGPTITNETGFECYIRPPQRFDGEDGRAGSITYYEDLDPKFIAEVQKVAGTFGYTPERFAGLGSFRPTSRDLLPTGLGFQQADLIGDYLIPTFIGGPNEEASYPTYGKEKFFVEDTTIAIGANVKRYDIGISWTKVSLDVHAQEAVTESREQNAGGAVNINVSLYKGDTLREKIALEKEVARASFLTTTGNYGSGHFQTLTGNALWSDYTNSDPLTEIFAEKFLVWQKARKRPDTFWSGVAVWIKLAAHPKIAAIAATALTGAGRPSAPVEPAFLSAILRMNVMIGEAGTIATPSTATFTDTWGKAAGLLCTGGNEPLYPRFALNVSGEAYPSTQEYRDERVGPRGGDVTKVADAWKTVGVLNTAGYLWVAAVA